MLSHMTRCTFPLLPRLSFAERVISQAQTQTAGDPEGMELWRCFNTLTSVCLIESGGPVSGNRSDSREIPEANLN